MARQVLVTGASGFVGSHLTEALEAQGYSVLAMTRHPDAYMPRLRLHLEGQRRRPVSSG